MGGVVVWRWALREGDEAVQGQVAQDSPLAIWID